MRFRCGSDVPADRPTKPRLGRQAARLPRLRGRPRRRRACHPAQTKTANAKTTSLLWAALHGLVIGRGRGAVDVKRRPGVVCLRVDELESQRRGKAIEQGKPIAECDRLQDEAVLVDQLQPTKGL